MIHPNAQFINDIHQHEEVPVLNTPHMMGTNLVDANFDVATPDSKPKSTLVVMESINHSPSVTTENKKEDENVSKDEFNSTLSEIKEKLKELKDLQVTNIAKNVRQATKEAVAVVLKEFHQSSNNDKNARLNKHVHDDNNKRVHNNNNKHDDDDDDNVIWVKSLKDVVSPNLIDEDNKSDARFSHISSKLSKSKFASK